MSIQRIRFSFLIITLWIMASMTTALVCHAFITLLLYPHLSYYGISLLPDAIVAPARILALLDLFCCYIAAVNAVTLARDYGDDPIKLFMKAASAASGGLAMASITILATSAFLMLDQLAQILAFGHMSQLSDALGGNISGGLLLITIVAMVITILLRTTANWLIQDIATIIGVALSWLLEPFKPKTIPARFRHARTDRQLDGTSALLAYCGALRAPPALSAIAD